MVGVPMLKAERISRSGPKLSDAQTRNFEAIKYKYKGDAQQRSPRHGKRAPEGPSSSYGEKEKGGAAGGDPPRRPRARARRMRVERRPPVSGALLSHGLTPQYHRRSAA